VGNLFIADSENNVIRKVNAGLTRISTVVGTYHGHGQAGGGYSGDGGYAVKARLNNPTGIATDSAGNLYIDDSGNGAFRKVIAATGTIHSYAGNGIVYGCGYDEGDGGPAADTVLCIFNSNTSIAVDPSGNLLIPISDSVRLVTPPSSIPGVTTAVPTFSLPAGKYGQAEAVRITDATPGSTLYVTLDGSEPTTSSQIYQGPIVVTGAVTIRAVAVAPGYLVSSPTSATYSIAATPASVITTVAGNGTPGYSGSGGPSTLAEIGGPYHIAVDGAGNLYFSDFFNSVVWKVTAKTAVATVVAGNGTRGWNGDHIPATQAQLLNPSGVAIDASGNLYIADTFNQRIRKVDAVTGLISTVVGDGNIGYAGHNGDGSPAIFARVAYPEGIVFDGAGNLYIADSFSGLVRLVNASTGIISTVAGTGSSGALGDGGPATKATLDAPNVLALDSFANLYIGTNDGRVRKVAQRTGVITTVAGDGVFGDSGDGSMAVHAQVEVLGLAVDRAGNVFISNPRGAIREVWARNGQIAQVAGNGYYGFSGDGGPASMASLNAPEGIAFDSEGNLYVADGGNARLRKISAPTEAGTPQFTLKPGTYTGSQKLYIADAAPGAFIYYTTARYSNPITVATSETVKAIAVAIGYTQSKVASATYTIQP
jgi:sugar lactone lactonase YvrE